MATTTETRQRGRTYRRYTTVLRFERGQPVQQVGDTWLARTEIGGVLVRVRLLSVKGTRAHPDEPGVTLMDCLIGRSEVR